MTHTDNQTDISLQYYKLHWLQAAVELIKALSDKDFWVSSLKSHSRPLSNSYKSIVRNINMNVPLSSSVWGSPRLIGIRNPDGSSASSSFNNSSSLMSFGAGSWCIHNRTKTRKCYENDVISGRSCVSALILCCFFFTFLCRYLCVSIVLILLFSLLS